MGNSFVPRVDLSSGGMLLFVGGASSALAPCVSLVMLLAAAKPPLLRPRFPFPSPVRLLLLVLVTAPFVEGMMIVYKIVKIRTEGVNSN